MAAVTRRGLYGGARSPYGSFSGKVAAAGKTYVKTFTRLALYGGARPLYGDFSGKVAAVVPVVPEPVHPPGTVRKRALHRRIMQEDEELIAIIMAFLQIKDD